LAENLKIITQSYEEEKDDFDIGAAKRRLQDNMRKKIIFSLL